MWDLNTMKQKQPASEILDRLPPHDIKAEQAVLGSILLDRTVIDSVLPIVQAGDFYVDAHRILFEHLVALCFLGEPIDPILLIHYLKTAGDFEAVGGAAAIAEIAQSVPVAAHAVYYAEIVRDKAARRRIIHKTIEALRDAYSDDLPTPTVLTHILQELDSVASEAPGVASLKCLTSRDLDGTDFNVQFFVQDVLAKGQPMTIIGPSKALKTSVVVDMGVSIATATHFLGKFFVPEQARIGILSGESGMAKLQISARDVCRERNLSLSNVQNLVWSDEVPKLTSPDYLYALHRFITSQRLEIVVIDPLYMAIPDVDTARLTEMGAVFRAANEVCLRTNCTLILCHHTVKRPGMYSSREEFGPPRREDAHGAGIIEYSRQWIYLKRREEYFPGEGNRIHRLWLEIGSSLGHGRRWTLDVDEGVFGNSRWETYVSTPDATTMADSERRAQDKLIHTRDRIMDALDRLNHPDTKTAILEFASLGKGKLAARAWQSLLDDGTISEAGTKTDTRGRHHVQFALSDQFDNNPL